MDDHSTDHSRDLLHEYAQRNPERTALAFNAENSGTAFSQWLKGIQETESDLVWIAESDDYCDLDFLATLVPFFQDESVMLAYARSTFIDECSEPHSFTFEHYLDEVNPTKWSCSYVETAHREVRNALAIKNSIPNVSAVLFRRSALRPLLKEDDWTRMRNCGDWIAYLRCIRGGKIAYSADTRNYFRFHSGNASKATHSDSSCYREHEQVACEIVRLYNVPMAAIERNQALVRRFYATNGAQLAADGIRFESLFDLDRVAAAAAARRPNVLICSYAFSTGGGELMAMRLADGLRNAGVAVTFFDYEGDPEKPGLVDLLAPGMPLLRRSPVVDPGGELLDDFGIEVINSHHACVDEYLALAKSMLEKPPPLFVTMHGMYEAMAPADFRVAWDKFGHAVDHWVYIADKNLGPFKDQRVYDPKRFTKLPNGLAQPEISPRSRNALGLPEGAFVVALASRAIPEKGWAEAVQTIRAARRDSAKDIRLLLIGDGPVADSMRTQAVPGFVQLMGFQADVLSLFAISDAVMLPSRFKGESFPLVLIESMMVGTPVVCSDLGESRSMIAADAPDSAGFCLPLIDGRVDLNGFSAAIVALATDPNLARTKANAARRVGKTFDITRVAEEYLRVFHAKLAGQQDG